MLNYEYVNKLKERVPLLTVVRKHLKSERVGIMFQCPFCQKKNCTLIVNDARNWYNSSSCSNQGDVFNFLHVLFGLSAEAAVEYLSDLSAEKYLSEIPDTVYAISESGDWKFYGEPR